MDEEAAQIGREHHKRMGIISGMLHQIIEHGRLKAQALRKVLQCFRNIPPRPQLLPGDNGLRELSGKGLGQIDEDCIFIMPPHQGLSHSVCHRSDLSEPLHPEVVGDASMTLDLPGDSGKLSRRLGAGKVADGDGKMVAQKIPQPHTSVGAPKNPDLQVRQADPG